MHLSGSPARPPQWRAGAASSLVAFFRTMDGSVGVSALGAATGHISLIPTSVAFVAFLAVLLIEEVPLRRTIERADELS